MKLGTRFLRGEEEVIAPNILSYELANAFAFKTNLLVEDAEKLWQKFAEYKIPLVSPNLDFIDEAIVLAKKYKVTVYDASYVVLAKEKRCDLITADDKFVDQVKLPSVKKLRGYLSKNAN